MRGHIAKKGRRYYVVIYEGVDASSGKPKRRWHAAGDTNAEAEKLLAELVKRVHDGDYRAPDKITVGDYASILLQQHVNPKVVSERLGHSSVAFTMTVYQHVMPGMQAQAAATFGAAVFGEQ